MKVAKILFSFLVFAGILLTSCNGSNDWKYNNNELKNAIELDTIVQLDDKLRISVSSENEFFKSNINKNSILVAPKINSDEKEELTLEDYKKARITDFAYKQIDRKNVVITLNNHDAPAYYVFFDKSANIENKLAQASALLYINEGKTEPIFILDNENYYSDASNPDFTISFVGANLNNPSVNNVVLGDAFSNLTIDNVKVGNGLFTIKTTGKIDKEKQGTITFKPGFFLDVEQDVVLTSDILFDVAFIDQTSYKFENNIINFSLHSIALDFKQDIKTSDIAIKDEHDFFNVNNVIYHNAKEVEVSLSVRNDVATNINEALEQLNNSQITLKDIFEEIDGDFSFNVNVYFPKIDLYPQLIKAEKLLILTMYLRSMKDVELTKEDVTLYNSNIVLEGDSKNAEIEQFDCAGNRFTMSIKLSDSFDESAYGNVRLAVDKVQTYWGATYSVFEAFDSTTVSVNNWADREIQTYSEQVIHYGCGEIFGNVIFDCGYLASSIASILTKDGFEWVPDVINNVMAGFQIWGFSNYNEPSITDVMNKLDRIENDVRTTAQRIDSFADTMEREMSFIKYGIDNIAFEQYKQEWVSFNKDYVEPLNDIIRTDRNSYRNKLKECITSAEETLDIRIYYCYKDGQLAATYPSKTDPYKSIEGTDIVKSHRVRIPVSYLAPVVQDLNANGYTDKTDGLLKGCIDKYLDDYPHLKRRVTAEGVARALKVGLKIEDSKKEDAIAFNNAFINYANQLSGHNTSGVSALMSYYKMMEGFYNFQGEASDDFTKFRAKQRQMLDSFTEYDNDMRIFTDTELDLKELNDARKKAVDFLQKHTNLYNKSVGADYSYVVHSPFSSLFVKGKYVFAKNETNKSLDRSFHFYNAADDTEVQMVTKDRLISQSQFYIMRKRYENMYSSGVEGVKNTFVAYLSDKAGLDKNAAKNYENKRTASKDKGVELLEAGVPVLCSFEGDNCMTASEAFKCTAELTYDDKSNYFVKDSVYEYGKGGAKNKASYDCWKSGEAKGTIIDLENVNVITETVNRWAAYNESHPSWTHDENWLFQMYTDGFYVYVFYLV